MTVVFIVKMFAEENTEKKNKILLSSLNVFVSDLP